MNKITSFEEGMIKVSQFSLEPKMVFFMVPRKEHPDMDLEIISFVSMNHLSKDLKDKIREELGLIKKT